MRIRTTLILGIAISLILLGTACILAQEGETSTQGMPPSPAQAPVTPPAATPETQWLYGEVVSVDAANKAITVKYLDYETDQEKEAIMLVDEKTAFDNAASLADIKPNDALSIDYALGSDGKNLAKNIGVEQPQAEGQMKDNNVAPAPVLTPETQASGQEAQTDNP